MIIDNINWECQLENYVIYIKATKHPISIEYSISAYNIQFKEKFFKSIIYDILYKFDKTINKNDILNSSKYNPFCALIIKTILNIDSEHVYLIDNTIWEISDVPEMRYIKIRVTKNLSKSTKYTIQNLISYSVKNYSTVPTIIINSVLNDILSKLYINKESYIIDEKYIEIINTLRTLLV